MMGEFEIGENKRLGLSLLSAQSHVLKKEMAAIHYRQALSKGSALLFEYGLIRDKARDEANGLKVGSYNLIQALILLTRGYSLKTTVERYNAEFQRSTSPDQSGAGLSGFWSFPCRDWSCEQRP